MEKVNVRLVAAGSVFDELDIQRIQNWKSQFFQIEVIKERNYLPQKSDPELEWEYSDEQLERSLEKFSPSPQYKLDLTIFILDAPIEDDYLIRPIGPNRIVLTYYDARDFLLKENIPLENYLISNIYTYVLLLLAKHRSNMVPILFPDDEFDITHHYREGCIYDFCGTKEDIVFSCVTPIICNQCTKKLTDKGITEEEIKQAEKEMKQLKRTLYYRIAHLFKKDPLSTFVFSCVLGVLLNVAAALWQPNQCCCVQTSAVIINTLLGISLLICIVRIIRVSTKNK